MNTWIKEQLELQREPKFTASLLPGIEDILGVRLPTLRKMAQQLAKGDWQTYLQSACDDSFEEIMLQGMVLGYAKGDLQVKEPFLRAFLPKINNWSVCDSTCSTLKLAKTQPEPFWDFLLELSCAGIRSNRQRKFAILLCADGAGLGSFYLLPGISERNAAILKGKSSGRLYPQ